MIGSTREIKVGLFVFIAFILLTVMVFSISDFYTVQPQYTLRVQFNFANGIQVGAPVRLAGVNVGEVKAIRVYRDEATQQTHAELGIRISRQARVEEDAVAYINTLGLIGEKYLEIVSGSAGARALETGDMLIGKDSIPTEQLVESGYRVMKKLEDTIGAIHSVVGDEATQKAFKGTLAHAEEASERLAQLLEQSNAVMSSLREGQGTVGQLLSKDDLYKDLQMIVADIKAHPWKLLYHPKENRK